MTLSAILLTTVLMQVPAETPPTAEQVSTLLTSTDAKDQAWGAWWTSESRISNLEPLLHKNLEAHVNGSEWQDHAVVDATLDAYIQSNSTPPPVELLESVYVRRPAPALILLSRIKATEKVDAFLLQLLQTEAGRGYAYEWFAASNILLAHRAPGLAAALLRDLRIETRVTVCDSVSPCRPGPFSRSFGDGGFGAGRTPGFPPGVAYMLLLRTNPYSISISTTLMEGPTAVGYSRRVSPANMAASTSTNGRSPGSIDPPRPFTSDRLQYVAAAMDLLDPKNANGTVFARLPIQNNEYRTIQWKTTPETTADIQQIRQDIQKRYSDVIQQLRSKQILSEDESLELANVYIDVFIDDQRTVDRTPLGSFSGR